MDKKNSKIKIFYIVNTLGYGGVEKYVVDIINNINTQHFYPIIVCLKKVGPLKDKIKNRLTIYELNKKEGNSPFLPFRLAKLIKKEGVDIIHSNNWGTFVESVIAKWISRAPVVIHAQHGLEMNDSEATSKLKRYKRNIIRHVFSYLTDTIAVVSCATQEFVTDGWKAPKEKVKLIYNGVDLNVFNNLLVLKDTKYSELSISKNDLIIGSVGRLMRVKNYPCLIRAFKILSQEFNHVKLLLIGEGPDMLEIKSLIEKLDLTNKIKLLGNRNDIRDILTVMDIFVLPSISEGISLSILEAMASHVPVVTTNVGGNPEIIENGKNGILVGPDNADELANAIRTLIVNPDKRKELGNSGRKIVEEKFALDRMVEDYESLYVLSLNKKGKYLDKWSSFK